MNIQELQAFNLADAAKFNFRLNPKLWGPDEHLLPEVQDKLLEIAEDFRQFLGIPELDVKDITISGSNAAYSYNDKSDIDLHLVVEFPDNKKTSEVYRELFDAKKFQYNKLYDYKIGDADVELYVQDADQPHHSQGIYSLLGEKWVAVPRRVKADVDDISVKHKYEDWGHKIEEVLKSSDEQQLEATLKRLKDMRAAGLASNGEFGAENLTFKLLRNNGLIQQLFDRYHAVKSERLSLEAQQKKTEKKKFVYGYSEDVTSTPDGVDQSTCQFLSEKGVEEDAGSTPDGVAQSTNMFLDDVNAQAPEDMLKDFVGYCHDRLELQGRVKIKLRRDPQWSVRNATFGRYNPNLGALEVAWGNRHLMDIFRTVAHELTHQKQNQTQTQPEDAGDTGSEWENEANAIAGVLMREWGQQHPELFDVAMIQAQDDLDEGKLSKAAAALALSTAMGMNAPAQGQSLGDALRTIQNIGTAAKTASTMTRAGINAEMAQELANYIRAQGGDPHGQNQSTLYQWQKRMEQDRQARKADSQPASDRYLDDFKTDNNRPARYYQDGETVKEGASGYIPTKKQAKDPRYSMALTVDIKPGQIGKEANKLKLKTNSQGKPQIARADGLFENLLQEYKSFKAREDYSPDEPPGPEFKPTMPAGTLRVDVSDVYDWYKLGQHISDLKGLGQHDFGQGPPSSVISFGDEDTEHKFIQNLKRTGLDVTDIDPVDPVKRAGGKIKTDPTYNVNEVIEESHKLTTADIFQLNNIDTQMQLRMLEELLQTGSSSLLESIEQSTIDKLQSLKNGFNSNLKIGNNYIPVYIMGFDDRLVVYDTDGNTPPTSKAKFLKLTNINNDSLTFRSIDGKTFVYPDDVLGKNAYAVVIAIDSVEKYEKLNIYLRLKDSIDLPSIEDEVNSGELKEDDLDEVKMSPGALEKFAASDAAKGIRAGFEAELIFRDTQGEAEELDPEPNYDADERAYSIQQVIDFFSNDEFGFGMSDRQISRLENDLDEKYLEWRDEQMMQDFRNDVEDLVRDLYLDETPMGERIIKVLTDGMEIDDARADQILAIGMDAPKFTKSSEQEAYAKQNPDYKIYLEAADDAEAILDEEVETSVEQQDGYFDQALDEYRDSYAGDDDSFFSDIGLRWMSDIANEFNLDWPVWDYSSGNNNGSRDWDDIGNSLEEVLGMPVKVSSNYHSTARREGQWIVEPDSSLQPDDPSDEAGLEIVSPPMPLLETIEKLKALVDWANDPNGGNAYSNSSTGLHMGISLPTKGGDVDYVKLITFMGDKYVLDTFGRSANTYAASAFDKIKQNLAANPGSATKATAEGVIKLLQHGLTELAFKELQKGVGLSKYTSAHIKDGYIEFRSPGGDWLAKADEEIGVLENTMMRFARAMAIAGDPTAERQEYAKKLYKLVTADNEQYADQLRLFSEFAAGTIDKEQLKKQWAQKTLEKDAPEEQAKGDWVIIDLDTGSKVVGMEFNNYTKIEAWERAKESGRLAAGKRYDIVPYNSGKWEIYAYDPDFDEEETRLEIVDAPNRGAAVDQVFDKYNAEKIPFKVRPFYGDVKSATKPKLTRRAELAKRIVTPKSANQYQIVDRKNARVVGTFGAQNDNEADKKYSEWLRIKGLPNDTEDYGYRSAEQAADNRQDSAELQGSLDRDARLDWRIVRRDNGLTVDTLNSMTAQQARDAMRDVERRNNIDAGQLGLQAIG